MFSIHCANNLLNGSASQSYGKVVQKKNDYAGKEPLKYQINIFVRLLIRPDWKKNKTDFGQGGNLKGVGSLVRNKKKKQVKLNKI